METLEFVSDNPYRLLNVPASTDSRELRQIASRVDKRIKVGIPHDSALEDLFGSEHLPDCQGIVRNTSPLVKTCHRIMWLLEYDPSKSPLDTLDSLQQYFLSQTPEIALQANFLYQWFRFAKSKSLTSLKASLKTWRKLSVDPNFLDKLVVPLVTDERMESSEAEAIVSLAIESVTASLLQEACKTAIKKYRASSIVQIVVGSSFKEDIIDKSLKTVVEFTDEIVEAIQESETHVKVGSQTSLPEVWAKADFVIDIASVMPARQLKVLDWMKVVRSFIVEMYNSDKSDDQHTLYFLNEISKMPIMATQSAQKFALLIDKDIKTIENNRNKKKENHEHTAPRTSHTVPRTSHTGSELWQIPARCYSQMWGVFVNVANDIWDMSSCLNLILPVLMVWVFCLPILFAIGTINTVIGYIRLFVNSSNFEQNKMEPIKSAPELGGCNGIGFRIYGNQPFDTRQNSYITTLYFTIFFIPVFPIKRYLVSDCIKGGWNFHGVTDLTLRQKSYNILFVVVLLSYIMISMLGGNSSPSVASVPIPIPPSNNVPNSTPNPPSVLKKIKPDPIPPPLSIPQPESNSGLEYQLKIDRLKNEIDNLKLQLATMDSEADYLDQQVKTGRSELKSMKVSLDLDFRPILSPEPSQAEIDEYNSWVRQRNQSVDEYERKRADFNRLVSRTNRKVRIYNSTLKRIKKDEKLIESLSNDYSGGF